MGTDEHISELKWAATGKGTSIQNHGEEQPPRRTATSSREIKKSIEREEKNNNHGDHQEQPPPPPPSLLPPTKRTAATSRKRKSIEIKKNKNPDYNDGEEQAPPPPPSLQLQPPTKSTAATSMKKKKKSIGREKNNNHDGEEQPPNRSIVVPTIRPLPLSKGKSDTIPAPYSWADEQRAMVRTLDYLSSKLISSIYDEVKCENCSLTYTVYLDLREKFMELKSSIVKYENKNQDKALFYWLNFGLPTCSLCGRENSVVPVISSKKRSINWLFLFLGKMLHCCNCKQLRYFAKHTQNRLAGDKDFLLFLVYRSLRKQLDPNGSFRP